MSVGRSRAQCSICYEALHPDTTNALLCGHTFHEACIAKWLGDYGKRTCPRCGLQCDRGHLIRVRYDVPDGKKTKKKRRRRQHEYASSPAVNQLNVDRLADLKKWAQNPPTNGAHEARAEVHDGDSRLFNKSTGISMTYLMFSAFTIWPFCYTTWPYTSSRLVIGIRNFILLHGLAYLSCLVALLIALVDPRVPYLTDKNAVETFTYYLQCYYVAYTLPHFGLSTYRALCSICYEALHPDTTSALLCGHTFHEACITKWLGDYGKRTCPRCRLRYDRDHLIRVRYDGPDDTEECEDESSRVVGQCNVDRLSTLKNGDSIVLEEGPSQGKPLLIEAAHAPAEVQDAQEVNWLDFPVSRVLNVFGLLPGPRRDTPMLVAFIASLFVALIMPIGVSFGPYKADSQLSEKSCRILMVYFLFSCFTTWDFCDTTWPYTSSRLVIGIRNFTLLHSLLYLLCLVGLLVALVDPRVPYLSNKDEVETFIFFLQGYHLVYSLLYLNFNIYVFPHRRQYFGDSSAKRRVVESFRYFA